MKGSNILALMALIGAAIVMPQSYAVIVIDADAPVVLLRTSCVEAGVDMNNCFTNSGVLTDWMHTTRVPSAQKPLLVKIGPGTFGQMGVDCSLANGYSNIVSNITIRGAGRGRTVLSGLPGTGFTELGGCQDISVEDMTITGGATPIEWYGSGSSNWTNVELIGTLYAWYGQGTVGGGVCVTPGLHKFFATTFSTKPSNGNPAFLNNCGKVWLWGSEITANVPNTAVAGSIMGAVSSQGAGNEMHIYGSSVSVQIPSTAAVMSIVVISATGGAQVHVHGTGIDAIAGNASPITVLSASSGSMIHANETSYNLSTGAGGTITRIVKDANTATHVHAPYLWEEHPNAPAITSVDGADMTVVTSTSDGRPHLLIYNSACTTSKWFDPAVNACR